MNVHFDIGAIRAAHARIQKRKRGDLAADGSLGAQARVNAAVLLPFAIAIAEESNRGSNGLSIRDAVAAIMANIVWSHVKSVAPVDAPPEMRDLILNDLLSRFGQCLQHSLDHDDPVAQEMVLPMQGGTA